MYHNIEVRRMSRIMRNALILSLLLPLISCVKVPKVPLAYEYPKLTQSKGTLVAVFANILDKRTNLQLDESISPSVVSEFATVASRETLSTGHFQEVRELTETPDTTTLGDVDILIQLSLNNVSIEVPKHGSETGAMWVGTVILGPLGAAMASSGKTDVIGHAQIGVKISDLRSGQIHQKQFEGQALKKVPAMWMDTNATRSSVAGMAIKAVLQDYIAFLGTIIGAEQ